MFAPLTTQGTDSFDDGDDVAAFADTNGSPLNATDAARRLLADTSDLADQESPTPPQSGGGGRQQQQQPAAANRIAAHLAKLRAGNAAANKSTTTTTTNGGYSAPTVNGGGAAREPSQVDFTKDTSNGGGGASAPSDLMSMSASSTSFAPVTLPPPSSLSASEMESGSGGAGGRAAFDGEGSYTYASPASPPPMDSSTPFLVGHHDDEHGDLEYRMSSYFAQFVRDVTACTRKVCGDAGVVFLKMPRWAQGCVAVVVVIILVKILHAIF